MSLDTRYRPLKYEDVLGQQGTIRILRQFVKTGAQFRQSYLFAGPYGSGKTTTARIFARAMLCDNPLDGAPCDACPNCRAIIEGGSIEELVEVDSATNSGKDAVRKVVEEVEYATFSGKRRIYLYDEAHQLSRDALDAMLKPMEENATGSADKKLVCIFCTTEPEKMRATILSRCAPAFVIHPVSPDDVAARLATVCDAEGIPYDLNALRLIAETTECHIRDALKAIEGVSMLGAINSETVASYLHLDRNVLFLDILENLGQDLAKVFASTTALAQTVSAATCYERLAEAALISYKSAFCKEATPSWWDAKRVVEIGNLHGTYVLDVAQALSDRPGRPSMSMLDCDLASLHQRRAGANVIAMQPVPQQIVMAAPQVQAAPIAPVPLVAQPAPSPIVAAPVPSAPNDGRLPRTPEPQVMDGVFIAPRAIRQTPPKAGSVGPFELEPAAFARLLGMALAELDEADRGSTGRTGMDRR